MTDYKFLRIPNLESWVVSAPKRAHRPNLHHHEIKCPFCPGREAEEPDVYRIGGENNDQHWQVRVIPNKYPFADIHEVVIHTPVHEVSMSHMPIEQIRLIIETYVNRFNTHLKHGAVCIFANSGHDAGESIVHPHSQITVVPRDVQVVVPRLEQDPLYRGEYFEVSEFHMICPPYSQWPDEVWVIPKDRGRLFGEIRYEEIESFSYVLKRLVHIFELRHGNDFPYNFYIYPFHDWYLRIMPRAKIAGGFEIATGIFVNTQDPKETMQFIKDHFYEEEEEKIRLNKAEYRKGV